MEKQLQYDSLYKFIVSIGVLVVAAPMAGYFLLLQKASEKLVTAEEWQALSAFSAEALRRRQMMLRLWWLPLIFAIIGAGIVGAGMWLWYKKTQKPTDEKIQLDLDMQRATADEKLAVKRRDVQADMEAEEPKSENSSVSDSEVLERVAKGSYIENACYAYIKNKLRNEDYTFFQNVRLGNMMYDLIATTQNPGISTKSYEIKYWPNVLTKEQLADVAARLEEAAKSFMIEHPRGLRATLFIVTEKSNVESWDKKVKEYTGSSLTMTIKEYNGHYLTIAYDIVAEEDLV